jgi:hypothetical protein
MTAVKDFWAYRKARMSPQHSSMEDRIRVRLQNAGIRVETDREFCLLSTTPDHFISGFVNVQKLLETPIAIYLDGPVHLGNEDRDEQLRDLLTKRHHIHVISIPYKGDSQREEDRVFSLIMEALS